MDEYIKRESAIKYLLNDSPGQVSYSREDAADCIRYMDAADVSPVRHGRWVDHCVRDWRCSECGDKIIKFRSVDGYCYDDKPNFCPNCGADMRGSNDE